MINKATAGILALSLIAGPAYASDDKEGATEIVKKDPAPGAKHELAVPANPKYIKESFSYNLSNQVGMGAAETGSAAAVNTVHSDGRYNFGGSSEGGAVKPCQSTPMGAGDTKAVVVPTNALDGCVGVTGYTAPGS